MFNRASHRSALAVALGAFLLAAGCGQQNSASDPTAVPTASSGSAVVPPAIVTPDGVKTLTRLSESLGIDYLRAYPRVQDMVAQVPVVLTGTVDSVLPGRSIVATSSDGEITTRDSTFVVRVKVTDDIKHDAAGAITDGFAYLSFLRAVNDIDDHGRVIGLDTYPSIEELQQAIPVGTRVAVATHPDQRALEGPERIEADPHPLPEGAVALVGDDRGTVFDQGKGTPLTASPSWPGLTFDEFVAQLRH